MVEGRREPNAHPSIQARHSAKIRARMTAISPNIGRPVHAGQSTKGGVAIDFSLSRKDVAETCGATLLHTVSRVLTVWEKASLVAWTPCAQVV